MTKDSAMRFGEYIAENSAHFEEWCKRNHYARTNIYGMFELHIKTARQAISEYRKAFGFTESEYHNWNKDKGWRWGNMSATVRI
jgi:hypothetical protein